MDERLTIAAQAMSCLLAAGGDSRYGTKKRLADNAIAYADMLLRRIKEIPADAQVRSEQGQHVER